jgi:hypothetical protein
LAFHRLVQLTGRVVPQLRDVRRGVVGEKRDGRVAEDRGDATRTISTAMIPRRIATTRLPIVILVEMESLRM